MVPERELAVAGLLAAIWFGEKMTEKVLRTSPVLGQLLAGVVVGPALVDFVPFVDAFRLVGKVGVMLLVVEGGLSVDLRAVQAVAPLAVAAAATGVLAPVLLAILVLSGLLGEQLNSGLAAGAALAPTSLGFSAKLLSEVGRLDSEEGVLICCAAVVDDVMALVLLSEIQVLSNSDAGAWAVARPLVGSLASIVVGLGLALGLAPRIDWVFTQVSDRAHRLECKLAAVLTLALTLATACAAVGSSDLLGCFLAGLVFSGNAEAAEAWTVQVKRLQRWGAALFFAATIGFGVPRLLASGGLLDLQAFWRGMCLTVAAVVGKLAVGIWAKPRCRLRPALTFGFAMMGRGEFSFLIADHALSDGLLSNVNYSAVVWALLVASATSPVFFRRLLAVDDGGSLDGAVTREQGKRVVAVVALGNDSGPATKVVGAPGTGPQAGESAL